MGAIEDWERRFEALARCLAAHGGTVCVNGWIGQGNARWHVWATQTAVASVCAPSTAAGAAGGYAGRVADRGVAAALRDALKIAAPSSDAEAFRAWVAALPTGESLTVSLAGVLMDPRVVMPVAALAALPGKISVSGAIIRDIDAVVVRGEGWVWFGASVAPRESCPVVAEFPTKAVA